MFTIDTSGIPESSFAVAFAENNNLTSGAGAISSALAVATGGANYIVAEGMYYSGPTPRETLNVFFSRRTNKYYVLMAMYVSDDDWVTSRGISGAELLNIVNVSGYVKKV